MRSASKGLVALLVIEGVRSASYGFGFLTSRGPMLGGFGHDPAQGTPAVALTLIGILGVGLLTAAAVDGLCAWLILRGERAGFWLSFVLGGSHLLFAGVFASEAMTFDAFFSLGMGGAIVLLASIAVWGDSRSPVRD